jgi:transcription elongation factor Elf1
LLGIVTGDMFRLYLSLAGSRSFITCVTMVTNVAMHEIATDDLRCIVCGSTDVSREALVSRDPRVRVVQCDDCERSRHMEVPNDG